MKSDEFIVNVKTKYGDQFTRDGQRIRDIDDKELMKKMLDRYPGERENIEDIDTYLNEDELTPPPPKTEVEEKITETKKGLFARIGDRLKESEQRGKMIQESGDNPVSKFLQQAGAGASLIGGIAEEGVKSIPVVGGAVEKVGETVGNVVQKNVVEPLSETPLIKGAAEGYQAIDEGRAEPGFEQVGPELLRDVQAGGEIAGLALGAKSIKPTAQAIKTGTQRALPAVDKATEGIRQAKIAKTKAEIDDAVGRILQGTPEDIAQGKRALSNIDTEGVKTYEDLNTRMNDKVSALSDKLDTYLDETSPDKLSKNDLALRINVDGKTVFQTPVEDAITELSDYYRKINDVANTERMNQLAEKLSTTGLTLKEVNNIAKLHGRDLNAFNASGELASGLSKQAAENTRKGLKNVVRERLPDDTAKELDKQMSDILQTSRLTKKMEEKVNQLYQKVKKRSLAAKAGGLAADVIDLLSLGTLRGFVAKLFPSNVGLKTANSLDLERELQKNLTKVQKLVDIEDPKKFSEAMTAYINEVQPGLSTRVTSGLSNTQKDVLLKRLDEVTSKDVMKGEQIDLDLMERLDELKTKTEKAGGLTEREYAELNALMDELPSFKSGAKPEQLETGKSLKYKTTVNIQDKDDLEYLERIFSRDTIEDIKKGKMENWRGESYEDLARINIISETPKTIAQKLEGKIRNVTLPTNTFYHGTSAESADAIMSDGFKTGQQLPVGAYRGGGYGKMQNSVSLAETPKEASIFSELTRNGQIVEVKLKPNAKVVSIQGIEDATDLEDFISYLKKQKIDAVYIGGGEKELVVLNPKSLTPVRLTSN